MSIKYMTMVVSSLVMGACASGSGVAQTPATSVSPPLAEAPAPAVLQQSKTYRLWNERAPGAQGDTPAETPTITMYRPYPGRANGAAVIIAPGGAYISLAATLEGIEPASWFTARGVTAFVLTYRVGASSRLPIPLYDGARAVRFVRAHAKDFAIDPNKIGMMGFSAGGHLTATTAVEATAGEPASADAIERVSSRPDYVVLAYPWLEGTQLGPDGKSQYCDFATQYSKVACDPQVYTRFKPLDAVTERMPPTFIYHTTTDELVPVAGSARFYAALVQKGVPAEFHAFAEGRHGSGLGGGSSALAKWPELLDEWLRGRGILPTR